MILLPVYNYNSQRLLNYEQTLRTMKRLALEYWTDLLTPNKFKFDFYNSNIEQVHKFIKDDLQYISDPVGIEHVTRARYSLAFANINHYPLDCDDKTDLFLCYLLLQNYKNSGDIRKPFDIYICVAGREKKPHHVYPMIDLFPFKKNLIIDATYPRNKIGEPLFPEKFFKKYHLFNDLK